MADLTDVNNFHDFEANCHFCLRASDPFNQTCSAFPNGIPKEILTGDNDHKEPVRGDNGILFEEKKEA